MTQEEFKEIIENWEARYAYPESIPVKGAIAFTIRMCTRYPELSKSYYDSLHKETDDYDD